MQKKNEREERATATAVRPYCKLHIYTARIGPPKAREYRWYVSCDKHSDHWLPMGPDNRWGRKTWSMAFQIGMLHQRGKI